MANIISYVVSIGAEYYSTIPSAEKQINNFSHIAKRSQLRCNESIALQHICRAYYSACAIQKNNDKAEFYALLNAAWEVIK